MADEKDVATEKTENLNNQIPEDEPGKKDNAKQRIAIAIIALAVFLLGTFLIFDAYILDDEKEKEDETEEKEQDVTFDIANLQPSFAVDEQGKPLFATEKFSTENLELYVTAEIENLTGETSLKSQWYYDDESIGKASLTVEEAKNYIWFSLSQPDEGWETGEYEMVIYHDDESVASTTLSIVDDAELDVKSFFFSGLGYYLEYQPEWEFEFLNDWSVMFSGPEGTEEYHTTVNIQNVLSDQAGGEYQDLEEHYEDYRAQILTADGEVTDYTEETLTSLDNEYPYYAFDAEFVQEGEEFEQRVYLLERDDDTFHQITYTAPVTLYDDYYHVFEDIMATFEIIK